MNGSEAIGYGLGLLSAAITLAGTLWAFMKFFGAPKVREVVREAVKEEIDAITGLARSVDGLSQTVERMRVDYTDLSSGVRSLGRSVDTLRETTHDEIAALRERMAAQETLSALFGRRESDRIKPEDR